VEKAGTARAKAEKRPVPAKDGTMKETATAKKSSAGGTRAKSKK
jgi:hypothetical protein